VKMFGSPTRMFPAVALDGSASVIVLSAMSFVVSK